MDGNSSASEQASAHKLVQVTAGEVVPGDRLRDHGILRQVVGLAPSRIEFSVVVFFDGADGFDDPLCVPLVQTVSVWRVCREQ